MSASRSTPAFHTLFVNDLVLALNLGCTTEERKVAQEVRVSLEFRFREAPPAVFTDELADTICYAHISTLIQEHCQTREYKTIERVGQEIFALVREDSEPRAAVVVVVHKVRPPVPSLSGGTSYRCGEFEA